jgi:NitT/TauT family transport system substrate-binding protein
MKKCNITRREFLVGAAAGASSLFGAQYIDANAWAAARNASSLRIAIEFNNHAASAIVAIDRKMYEARGLDICAYDSYSTGAALASALTRGAIGAAYICLIPAINAYANGGVPIKVVCGTHFYGYGLAVNPEKIRTVKDLEKPGIRIGCLAEGTAVAAVMHKTIEKYNLNRKQVLSQIKIMGPTKSLLAVRAKQLDVVFLPEHWATMTERYGFSMLLTAKDVWPDMIGSVVVAREELIANEPEKVQKLVQATKEATLWMQEYPDQAAQHVARYLSFGNEQAILKDVLDYKEELKTSFGIVARSMGNLEYATFIDKQAVQDVIDNAARLGNIKYAFEADKILDLQFLP